MGEPHVTLLQLRSRDCEPRIGKEDHMHSSLTALHLEPIEGGSIMVKHTLKTREDANRPPRWGLTRHRQTQ
jgi:hypothetical protein